jgi:hypothetical protein
MYYRYRIVPSKIVSNNYSMKVWYLENMNRTEWSILTSYPIIQPVMYPLKAKLLHFSTEWIL